MCYKQKMWSKGKGLFTNHIISKLTYMVLQIMTQLGDHKIRTKSRALLNWLWIHFRDQLHTQVVAKCGTFNAFVNFEKKKFNISYYFGHYNSYYKLTKSKIFYSFTISISIKLEFVTFSQQFHHFLVFETKEVLDIA